MSESGVRGGDFYGASPRPALLRQVRSHVRLLWREVAGGVDSDLARNSVGFQNFCCLVYFLFVK